jgi:POT family proton-dependent oligopeptide transporter
LILFIERNVHREIAGLLVPTASILGFNPFIMLILGPLLSLWWLHRSRQNKLTATSSKFAAGIFAVGLAFACLAIGVKFADTSGYNHLIWTILFFIFISIGEIIIAPAGYAMIGVLIEDNFHSIALGIWQLMTGVGTALSGDLAQFTTIPHEEVLPLTLTNKLYFTNFTLFALAAILIGIAALGLIKFQRKAGI